MKRILIGHRGVGKSSLLQRLTIYENLYGETVPVYDLDREIEKMSGASVSEIFSVMGEAAFRKMEAKTLDLLLRQKNLVVALGAGFPLDSFFADRPPDKEQEIIWVRRPSDQSGRIFLNRPRLNPEISALSEFQLRYEERNSVYARKANWIYDLPEGQSFPSEIERDLFSNKMSGLNGGITLLPSHGRNYESFKSREWRWDFDFFELRDDLLSDEELKKFFALLDKNQILISFRKEKPSSLFLNALKEGFRADWSLELGSKIPEGISILSVHERAPEETLPNVINRLEAQAHSSQILKLAVEIFSFSELEIGLHWQALDPARRNFLPRSKTGRWSWVRLWLKDRQFLNFIRQGDGSALDQPTLTEWLSTPNKPNFFAAVLGSPVSHSYSPAEHCEFFRPHDFPFFSINISEAEWSFALPLLEKLGLRAAAVTAPLKKLAFQLCKNKSQLAEELGAVNTLWLKRSALGQEERKFDQKWSGENTDFIGFKSLLETMELSDEQKNSTVIWGGGGTLPVLKRFLPTAQTYSIRSGEPRTGQRAIFPQVLIWAGPPSANLPPNEWRPELIIDLNYREDSLAKEYGQRLGARYISGLPMFKAQAQAQQEIWQSELWQE